MSFTGEFRHTLDSKGRLTVPSRMRDALPGDRVVLTRWLEGCIAMWSTESFSEMQAALRQQGSANPKARQFARIVNASAHPDGLDGQGRVTVPQHLRDMASISKDAVIVGADTHGEIWHPDRWREQKEAVDDEAFVELAANLNF